MEGIKIVAAGSILALLLAVVALQNPRVASDLEIAGQSAQTSTSDQSVEVKENGNAEEQTENASHDGKEKEDATKNSVKVDFSFSFNSDGTKENEEEESGEAEEPEEVGLTISCAPGERYKSEDGTVECKNRNGNTDIKIDLDEKSGGSFKYRIRVP